MQSLRTRRPSDGPPKAPKPQQQKLAKTPSRRAGGSARKSRVDDKIKKRMSMRYADISGPTDVSGVPEMPALPIALIPGRRAGGGGVGVGGVGMGIGAGVGLEFERSVSGMGTGVGMERIGEDEEGVRDERRVMGDTRASDLRLLERESFDPDAYLKAKMAASTEAEIRSLQSHLQSLREDTNVDLRRNVFNNYAEFMMISKEVSTLENDMLELKESLNEWKSMPSLLHINDAASLADRRRTARSSVADLRVLYASQMQTLHSQIEGSAKFVPAIPGRHIITEMEDISMLNAATFRVEHSVKFVLLDDAVLVARKRTRRTADRPLFVAERSWPLNDILVLDTKDTPTLTNVFKIRHAKETFVFRTDLTSDKRSLLSQFRQVAEELAAKKRKEREGEHERRKTLWMSGGNDRRSFALDPDIPGMSDWMSEFAIREGLSGGAKEKEDKDMRMVNELTDELTVCIALREWEKAVTLVEQGEAKLSTTPILEPKLTALKKSLTSALIHALSEPTLRRTLVLDYTTLLQRLHAAPADRNAFLAARAELTKKRVRMIRAEGHIPMYIADLSIVVFTGIRHTADWYLASYRQHDALSTLVDWARKQIEVFAELFRKQVFTSDVDQKTIDECLKITQEQGKKVLAEFGFDFQYLFDQLLVPHPTTPASTSTPSAASPTVSSVERAFKAMSVQSTTSSRTERSPATRRPPPGAPPPRSRNRPPSTTELRSPAPPLTPRRDGMF